jgi:ribosomal protein L11 methyltransferase
VAGSAQTLNPMFELVLACSQAAVAPIEQALQALGAVSVSWEDLLAGTPEEEALFGEPGCPLILADDDAQADQTAPAWAQTRLIALFDSPIAAEQAVAHLQALSVWKAPGCQVETIRPVPDLDWVKQTQSQFQAIAITPDFWVVPSWHDCPSQAKTLIRLDPGLAFGTGTHPTTALCLRWLAQHPHQLGQRVLDYGCGSGILAIGAALLGGPHVTVDAVDIDPQALQATQDNASANGVRTQIHTSFPEEAPLCCDQLGQATLGAYDLVVANILSRPLQVLAPLLCQHVKPGGCLLLSGILARQDEEIIQSYAPWMSLQVAQSQDGWVLMHGKKK